MSSYHKSRGDATQLVRGCENPRERPDRIYVTSLFTWAWRPVWEAVRYYKERFPDVEVWLGGIYASLLPDHAKLSGADYVHVGLYREAEDFMPDYDLVPEWDGSILFASRGCIRRCGFCAVPKIEGRLQPPKGSIKPFIHPRHTRIIFFDNNILAAPNWREVFDEVIELCRERKMKVDFNQGLDARLVTDEVAEKIAQMRMDIVRMAYDYSGIRKWVERAIEILKAHGIKGRKMIFYVLYNYTDDPDDFFHRVRDLLNWGVVAYPMRYEPLNTLEKNRYVAPKWDEHRLEMVAKARRVIGYAGAFPPYEGLVKKFNRAEDFDQAFVLRPLMKEIHGLPKQGLKEMALEHELTVRGRTQKPRWGGPLDWRAALTGR